MERNTQEIILNIGLFVVLLYVLITIMQVVTSWNLADVMMELHVLVKIPDSNSSHLSLPVGEFQKKNLWIIHAIWLDNLKIRGSWGSLGNQNVANYAYIASYGAANYISWVMNNEQLKGMNPTAIVASDLTWETASTLDFGIDFSILIIV